MNSYEIELAMLEQRLTINPDDAGAKRRIGDVRVAVDAARAAETAAPVVEVVDQPLEVEQATLPKTTRKKG